MRFIDHEHGNVEVVIGGEATAELRRQLSRLALGLGSSTACGFELSMEVKEKIIKTL